MNLPRPADQLADCVWLPRIIAKARHLAAGTLTDDYAARFGHASGVDGQFLSFFNLTKDDVVAIAGLRDDAIADWFRSLSDRREGIPQWNHLASNPGRTGFPMAERLPVALTTTYRHLAPQTFATVFDVLDADEASR